MKVAVVTSFPDDPGAPVGGVEAVSVNLVRALTDFADLDIHVVTTRQNYSVNATASWGKAVIHRLAWAGGSVLRHASGPGRRQVQEYLRQIRPDVIHAHDTYGLMTKGMAVPRVFTVHGFIYGDTLVSGTRLARLRSHVWRQIETAGWADQPHIISISPYVRERLSGIVKGTIHDIDNPVSDSFFSVDRKDDGRTVFCAAIVAPRKNTMALVEAIGQLVEERVDVRLRLAGSLDDETYVQRIRRYIEQKRLGDHVVFVGRIDTVQVHRELSSASVFALTSLEENSPMGIEEAMAAGVPVVTSNRCGMPYMVRDGESGFLVNPNRPKEIAQCLKRLLKDDVLRRSMGLMGKAIAQDRFRAAKVAARTREVYLRAVQDSVQTF
jgi:glycosyltransferase involved in cell wall biosynthesis